MWFSVYELAEANRLDPKQFSEFAKQHMTRYGVELYDWCEIVVDVSEAGNLLEDFRSTFPEYAAMQPDGDADPECDWCPLDFFRLDEHGKRIWSEGNPKWKEAPPVVKRRLP